MLAGLAGDGPRREEVVARFLVGQNQQRGSAVATPVDRAPAERRVGPDAERVEVGPLATRLAAVEELRQRRRGAAVVLGGVGARGLVGKVTRLVGVPGRAAVGGRGVLDGIALPVVMAAVGEELDRALAVLAVARRRP